MRAKYRWILLTVLVGVVCWGIGRYSNPGFELRVEVSDTGTVLTSQRGCGWKSASYSGGESSYTFEVSKSGVRSVGPQVASR